MSEARKILELDISTDEILRKSAELRKELDKLRDKRKELRKQDGDNSKELAKLDAGIKSLSSEYRKNQKALSSLYEGNERFLSTQDRLNLTLEKEVTSINSARDANKDLLAIRNELNLATEEGRKNRDIINKQIDKNNAFIKENVSELEQQKIGIGGYKDAINEAIQENGLFQGQITEITNIFQSFSPVLNQVKGDFNNIRNEYKANTTATEDMTTAQRLYLKANNGTVAGLKLLRLALIGTGIGAIVVLIGSLVAYLASTQEGIDKVNRVLTPMKEIFAQLFGVVQDFGKGIFEAFSNPKKLISDLANLIKNNLINRFQALANIINKVINFDFDGIGDDILQAATGVEDVTGKVAELGNKANNFFKEAIQRGQEIQKLQEEIEKGQNALIINEARIRAEIKEQNKIAEDQTKTLKERELAAKRSVELSKELLEEQQAILDKEIEQLKLKQIANDTSREDEKELNELIARRYQFEEQALELQTTQTNKLNTIRQQAEAQMQKDIDARIAKENEAFEIKINQLNEELDLFIAQQGDKAKSRQEELDVAKEVSEREKEILEEKYKAGKLSETEYQTELLNIKREFAKVGSDIAIEIAKEELERKKALIDLEVENAIEKNNRLAEVEREFQAKRLEQGVISQQEYNQAINAINEENRLANIEAEAERRELEKQLEIERENTEFEARFERKRLQLEKERQLAVQEAERLGVDVTSINERFAKKQQAINDQKNIARIDSDRQMINQLTQLANTFFGENKAIISALALADTFLAAQKAYLSQFLPVPDPSSPVRGAVAAGVAISKGLANVAQINGVSLATGGILDDPSLPGTETSDSIPAQLSKGESVINAKSTKMFKPILSAINQAGGGVRFNTGGIAGVSSAVREINQGSKIDYDKLASMIGIQVMEGVKSLPPGQVAVSDIRRVNDEVSQIEARANHE
jgi:uncharacterized membrane protein